MNRYPQSAQQWWALVQCLGGALLGWVMHPTLWLAWGPRRYLAMIATWAFAESRYNRFAMGDETSGGVPTSFGILAYLGSTWEGLGGTKPVIALVTDDDYEPHDESADIWSPFVQGYRSAKYYQDRILADWGILWQMAIPWYGIAYARWEWRHAAESNPADLEATYAEFKDEQAGDVLSAWAVWSWLSLCLLWMPILSWCAYRTAFPKKKGRK